MGLAGLLTLASGCRSSQKGSLAAGPSISPGSSTASALSLSLGSLPNSATLGGCSGPFSIQSVNSSGGLTPLSSSVEARVSLAVSGSARIFSSSSCTGSALSSITIPGGGSSSAAFYIKDPVLETFTLTADGSSANLGVQSQSVTVSGHLPQWLYVTNYLSGSISRFSVDPSTGLLASQGTVLVNSGDRPWGITIDPSGKFAYVVCPSAEGIQTPPSYGPSDLYQYSIDPYTGDLDPLSVPVLIVGGAAHSLAFDATGRWAYLTNSADSTVGEYSLDSLTGLLAPLATSTIPAASFAASITADPWSQWLYTVSNHAGQVNQYAISSSNGELSALSPASLSPAPNIFSIITDPAGKFAYVTQSLLGSGEVYQFSIQSGTGALIALSPASVAVGSGAQGIRAHPNGKWVYVVNYYDNDVQEYSSNPITGQLTSLGTFPAGTGPVEIAIDPTGQWAYVSNSGSNTLSEYSIDSVTGALTALSTASIPTGTYPIEIRME